MKKINYALIIGCALICAGCGMFKKEAPVQSESATEAETTEEVKIPHSVNISKPDSIELSIKGVDDKEPGRMEYVKGDLAVLEASENGNPVLVNCVITNKDNQDVITNAIKTSLVVFEMPDAPIEIYVIKSAEQNPSIEETEIEPEEIETIEGESVEESGEESALEETEEESLENKSEAEIQETEPEGEAETTEEALTEDEVLGEDDIF